MLTGAKARIGILGLTLGLLGPSTGTAASFDSLQALSQDRFLTLSENIAAAIHYKGIGPAEPLGIIGFDLGIEVSSTEIDEDLFGEASSGGIDQSEFIIPRLHINKGLPFGLDVGAAVSAIPGTDINILSGELRYALLSGGIATPAVGIRASHAILEGVSEFDMSSSALELTASKGFLLLTPYAGAGIVKSTMTPNGLETLTEESFDQKKVFVGVTINLGFAITLEADRTDDYRTYSAKVGFRF